MPGSLASRVWRPYATVALALYVCFLAVSPFEHHDILCHLKTPQHCTSCSGSALGSDPHPPVSAAKVDLVDAGCPFIANLVRPAALLPVSSSGRSPPIAL